MRKFPYKYARLKYAVNSAILFQIDNKVSEWPINPKRIINENGWHLKSYSVLAAYTDGVSSANEVSEQFLIDDAFTLSKTGAYYIAYNDTVTIKERIRFSLCHEIGHIVLGHFDEFDVDVLTERQRDLLDREANAFAANLLCPVPLYDHLEKQIDQETMRGLFGMSKQSWGVRRRTLCRDRYYLDAELDMDVEGLARKVLALTGSTSVSESKRIADHPANKPDGAVEILSVRGFDLQYLPSDKRAAIQTLGKSLLEQQDGQEYYGTPLTDPEMAYRVWMQDEIWKRECKKARRFHEVLMEENPMVIDELWEPKRRPSRRRI